MVPLGVRKKKTLGPGFLSYINTSVFIVGNQTKVVFLGIFNLSGMSNYAGLLITQPVWQPQSQSVCVAVLCPGSISSSSVTHLTMTNTGAFFSFFLFSLFSLARFYEEELR